ncbi:MAG: phosphoribosylformylglycinamidine synthase subunit PurL [Candidatus Dadabacteria bacterium]|nr:phosphoribosylformylglycinamidine synthase subunit PurL [Candidatus Dadabacteria bacterium]
MSNARFALERGLSQAEYEKIVGDLGREPNQTEIGILAAMWSEHCSYKSSRTHLKRFPTTGERVIQGPGENAGVVDIGDGLCAVFKMESHNHPSYIEPYQGAATGVGGILRDIFTMGARPIALLDSLRFGNPALPKTKYLVDGVVSGIAGYGNCIGIPTVGGEVYFEDCYDGNPLVNVFALGVSNTSNIFRGLAKGVGNPLMYVGSKTGRDGIHGAVMASETFSAEAEEKRPAVQVGDPFTEKLLLEACLELFKTGAVVGIQDMGAAGLTSSSTEMASRAGTGVTLNIDKIPIREMGMSPYEVMLSESQERMLIVVEKGKEGVVEKIFEKWDLDFSTIGEVTGNRVLNITKGGATVADLPIELITEQAPTYDRPYSRPSYLDRSRILDLDSIPVPDDLNSALLSILSSPNISNKKWIYEQYDHMVRANTICPPGTDAAVIRIKGTRIALGLTVNCNSRYCYLDPFTGSMISVAECARNLACSGAMPLALTDCLNFGNPEKTDIMWQFKRSVDGISEAAAVLSTPVVSGNVSFYNETGDSAIYPTPTVAMVGLIDDYKNTTTQWFQNEGDAVVMIGDTEVELGGSEYLKTVHNLIAGAPPRLDLNKELDLIAVLKESIDAGLLHSAHDLSEGGLGTAVSESCFNPKAVIGVKLHLDFGIREDATLFSETQSRALVSVDKANLSELQKIADKHSTPMHVIGEVGGDRLRIKELVDMPVEGAFRAWNTGFETKLKTYG